jgi:hypothetical protein
MVPSVALGQIFLQAMRFYSVSIMLSVLHTRIHIYFIYRCSCTALVVDSVYAKEKWVQNFSEKKIVKSVYLEYERLH